VTSRSECIVVGYDGSVPAGAALDWAAAEAERRHLSLTVLLAIEEVAVKSRGHAARLGLGEQTAHRLAAESLLRARRVAATIEITVETHTGAPIHALIQHSRQAELIVLGAHGRNQPTGPGAVAGPVALDVSARAHCPVMIIRAPEAQETITAI
jgi:nucleotide-binding universal stress UspA family protein